MPSSRQPQSSKKSKSKATDWLQVSLDGGMLLLDLFQDVASLAPIPYLSVAAGLTVKIVEAVQRFKGNKADFQQLADDVTAIVAVVCDSYKGSAVKDEWPPHDLVPVIASLLTTLQQIYDFIQNQQARNRVLRFIYSLSDEGQIKQYRERLAMAVDKFQIASHLNLNNAVAVILQQQKDFGSKLDSYSSVDINKNSPPDRMLSPISTHDHSQFDNAIDSDVTNTVIVSGDVGHEEGTAAPHHGVRAHTQFKGSQNAKIGAGSVVIAGSVSARSFAEALSLIQTTRG